MTLGKLTPSLIKIGFILLIGKLLGVSSQTLWNAALCKPSSQSTIRYGYALPKGGNDGNRNTRFGSRSCIHTSGGYDNWWMVDLLDQYLVHAIVITNRNDAHADKIVTVQVDLFASDPRQDRAFPNSANATLCTEITKVFKGTRTFTCPTPTYARFVKLMKTNFGHLNLCEVQAMVSKRNTDLDSQKKAVSKVYNILRNSVIESVKIVTKASASTAAKCMQLCVRYGGFCHGFSWTQDTRDCQILTIDNIRLVVVEPGTDFYIEPYMAACLKL